jgi:hypothetical protein
VKDRVLLAVGDQWLTVNDQWLTVNDQWLTADLLHSPATVFLNSQLSTFNFNKLW